MPFEIGLCPGIGPHCQAPILCLKEGMKTRRLIFLCLGVQAVAIVFGLLAFAYFEDPKVAGRLTGPLFLLSGSFPFLLAIGGWLPKKTSSVVASMALTLFFSLPMLMIWYQSLGTSFVQMTFFGIPGPIFHRLSSGMFLILIGCEVFDLWKFSAKVLKP